MATQDRGRTVPSFAGDDAHDRRKRERERERRHRSEQHYRERSREHKHRDRDRGRDRERDRSRDRNRERERNRDTDRDSRQSESLFVTDTRGDALVWQYGSNDRARVPAYHRYGYGRMLGAGGRFVFRHEGATERFSALPPRDGVSAPSVFRETRHPLLLRAMASAKRRRNKKPEVNKASEAAADFVSLVTRKRKRSVDSGSGSHSDSNSDSGSDSDSTSDSDPDFGGENTAVASLKQKLAELSARVQDAPTDVDAWLALVDLQDQQRHLLGHDDDDDDAADDRAPDEVAGIAKVRLSMLDTALRQVQQPADRARLQLARMREGARAWTPQQLAQRWEELARSQPGGQLPFGLWRARLDAEATTLSSFSVDRLRACFVDRLQALRTRAAADTDAEDFLYGEMVYVFLRATRCLYDAGFSDLATAAWQAQLESTFCRPVGDSDDLGAFWDSEVPRIGEAGAQGWSQFAARVKDEDEDRLLDAEGQRQTLPTVDVAGIVRRMAAAADAIDGADGVPDVDEHKPLYASWAAVEQQRAVLAALPARLLDDVDDSEDVFRVVVYADIQPLLFSVPRPRLAALAPLLVDAYLLFCQLPPAFATSRWIQTARNDPFLASVCLGTDEQHDGQRPLDRESDGSQLAVTADMLFAQPGWFRYLPSWLGSFGQEQPPPVPPTWVANTLRQLATTGGVAALAPYSLAVDVAVHPDGTKKAARALIKRYRTHAGLYNAYALAELARGRPDVARSVLDSALAAAAAAQPPDVEAELALRQTGAWLELDAGRATAALRRLLPGEADSLGDEDGPASPAQLLRARQTLRAGMDYGLSMGQIDRAALFAQSFVLLEFLAAAARLSTIDRSQHGRLGPLQAALDAAAAFSAETEARGHAATAAHERLLQSTARLIYHYARTGPYRPADLQTPLRRFVTLFPRNGVFLRLFAWVDPAAASGLARLRLDDPLRRLLDTVVLARDHDAPSSRAFAVRHARQTGGSGAAARTALARALASGASDSAAAGSPQLWQAYVALAASADDDDRDRSLAKDVFYRAVQACPGSKAMLLAAFAPGTAAALSPAELRAVFHTMLAKGLRVHVDLQLVREQAKALAEAERQRRRQ